MLPCALWNRSHSDSAFSSAEPRLWNQPHSDPSIHQHQLLSLLPSLGLYVLLSEPCSFPWLRGPLRPFLLSLGLLSSSCSGSWALLSFFSPSREHSCVLEPQTPRWVPSACCWTCCSPRHPLILHICLIYPQSSNDRGGWAVAHMHIFPQPSRRRSPVTTRHMSNQHECTHPATSVVNLNLSFATEWKSPYFT